MAECIATKSDSSVKSVKETNSKLDLNFSLNCKKNQVYINLPSDTKDAYEDWGNLVKLMINIY